MTDDDTYDNYEPVEGTRWVEVYAPEQTNRMRLVRIASDAPDPKPYMPSPEDLARTEAVIARMVAKYEPEEPSHD
jgi:hypothetical protein